MPPTRAVLAAVCLLGSLLAGCSTPAVSPPPGGTRTPTTTQSDCADLAGRLDLPEQAGQLLMVAVDATGLDASEASLIGRTGAGSVLLAGGSTAGVVATQGVVAAVREAADRPQRVSVLVAADQEGGAAQALSGSGFSEIPAALEQATLSDAGLSAQAEVWGDQLDSTGVNLNLAPVADVVPQALSTTNVPVGRSRRGYGASPATVAAKATAVIEGMNDAGVATAVKHFPGLGRVQNGADTVRFVVDTVTTREDPTLEGFAAAVEAGVDMVVVSSATYTRIDPRRRAVFSPVVIGGMLRGDLGFDGVVVSGDLAKIAVSAAPGAERAVRFVRAGGDLALVGDPTLAARSVDALVTEAERDPAFAARVEQSAARVLAVKARRGLAPC